jgi:hypothetical protein
MSSTKLAGPKQWAMALTATGIGVSLSLFREYNDTGAVALTSVVRSLVIFCLGVALIAAVFRYANRPEPGDKHD